MVNATDKCYAFTYVKLNHKAKKQDRRIQELSKIFIKLSNELFCPEKGFYKQNMNWSIFHKHIYTTLLGATYCAQRRTGTHLGEINFKIQ